MDEKTYNEVLLEKYQYYIENLSEKAFIQLFTEAYKSENRAKDWWNEFNKLSLIDKIYFMIDDENLYPFFKGYCIGYSIAREMCY